MNKDLVVSLKAHGIGTIVMNLPVVSEIIHASENDEVEFLDVIYTISDELDRVGIAELVEEDGWDIDEIHDGNEQYEIGLYDYEGTPIKTVQLEEA